MANGKFLFQQEEEIVLFHEFLGLTPLNQVKEAFGLHYTKPLVFVSINFKIV